jgi:hypothetical protein
VKGIDSIATNLPTGIDPTNGIDGHSDFDLRSITLKLRDNPAAPQKLLTNPSQCDASAFSASFTGTDATHVTKTEPFQATNCGALGFSPRLSMSLIDSKTGKAPAPYSNVNQVKGTFDASLTANPDEAGIKNAKVVLPLPVTVNVPELPASCTVAQYTGGGAAACPQSSIVGSVEATSPLLYKPLKGNVYLVKSTDPAVTLPRLLIALRGDINTDIFGNMKFLLHNGIPQIIETTFPELPDAPISTFKLHVENVITTRPEACSYTDAERFAQTSYGAFNGSATSGTQSIPITCTGSGEAKFKNKGKKSTLALSLRAPAGTKFKTAVVKLPKGLKYVKKGFKKRFSLKAGTKKLKASCVKVNSSSKLTAGFCKKYDTNVTFKFAAGTLTATKKVKKPKLTIEAVDSAGRKYSFIVQSR